MQESMQVDFYGGESKLLTFQAPKFKYDLWDLVEYAGNSNDYIKENIFLPDPDTPTIQLTRTIYFKIQGQESVSTQNYFTYEVKDNGLIDTQLTDVEFTISNSCLTENF